MSGWKVAAWVFLVVGLADVGVLGYYGPEVWAETGEETSAPVVNDAPSADAGPPGEPESPEPTPEPDQGTEPADVAEPTEPAEPAEPDEVPEAPEPVPDEPDEPPKVADLTKKPPPDEPAEKPTEPPEPAPEPADTEDRQFTLTFETGRIRLEPSAKQTLREVVRLLEADPELVLSVEGHADQRGASDKNLNLSSLRATVVVKFVKRRGIARSRIRVRAFGETRLLTPENSPTAWEKNRRVELLVHKGDT